ncbi:MAG: VTT domain-containing protein [Pseudomonadales bacterium]|nr:VTT domain-containing protein [Pseudomonadales bacterium]
MGGVLTCVAAVTSYMVTYWLIKTLGGDALRQLESPIAKRVFGHLDEYPLRSQIVLRTIFQTAPGLNYSLALSRVRPQEYFLALLLGLPLPIFLYCVGFEFLIDYFMARA